MNRTRTLSVLCIAFGLLLYIVSVAGAFWPATPPTDIGVTSTSSVFILMGLLGLVVAKQQHTA